MSLTNSAKVGFIIDNARIAATRDSTSRERLTCG
jgi:hypothetical protein